MAYLQTAALVTRLREVLEDSAGVARQIPPSRFTGDLPEGLSSEEQVRRAFGAPRIRADVAILGRSKYSPPILGNVVIYDVKVTITSLRIVARAQQLDSDANDVVMALAYEDGDILRQALEYPQNLAATEAGASTNLASGMLCHESSEFGVVRLVDEGAQKLESKHTFRGWIKSLPEAPPVNTVAPVASGIVTLAEVLSCTTGSWTASSALTYTYQWKRDGTAISGETASTHTVVAGDVGHSITCTVRATALTGGWTQATSNTLT